MSGESQADFHDGDKDDANNCPRGQGTKDTLFRGSLGTMAFLGRRDYTIVEYHTYLGDLASSLTWAKTAGGTSAFSAPGGNSRESMASKGLQGGSAG